MGLTHVASPAGSATRRAGNTVGNSILTRQHAYTFHSVLGDDIAGKYLVVFLYVLGDNGKQLLHILHKIRVKVGHDTAETVVVEGHAGATGLLHYVKNLLTHTQGVEQHRSGAEVHAERPDKQTVGGDTRKLVHKHTDYTGTFRHLDTGSLLNAEAQTVVVVVSREVIQTIHEMEGLHI